MTSWQVDENLPNNFLGWQVAKIILKHDFFAISQKALASSLAKLDLYKLTSWQAAEENNKQQFLPLILVKQDAPFVVGTINIWFVNFNLYSIVDISAVRESIHFALKQPSTLWKTKLIFAAPCYSTTFWVRKYLQVVFEVLLCVECEKDCWQNLVISLPEIGTEGAM